MTDFRIHFHGSLVLLEALTPDADDWCIDNLPSERTIFGTSTVVEPRYIDDIVEGIHESGLTTS